EGQRGPPVLRNRLQPVIEFLHGGADIGSTPRRIAPDFHQRVRLLGTSRQYPARTVILEGAANKMHAVGEQRRGQRVALYARVSLPIKGESRRFCVAEAARTGNAIGIGHYCATPGNFLGFGSPAL